MSSLSEQISKCLELHNHQGAYQLLLDSGSELSPDQFDYYMIICGYYVKDMRGARKAIDRIMLNGNHWFEFAHQNYSWYEITLGGKKLDFSDKCITLLFNEREEGNPIQVIYFASNPSIVTVPNGYLVNIRFVNYLVHEGQYPSTSPKNMIKTKNVLVELDKQFNEVSCTIVNEHERPKYNCLITGIEDIRLKPGSTLEDTKFIGTVCDFTPNWWNRPRMVLGNMIDGKISHSFIPAIPNTERAEKNWIPIEGDDRYMYGFENTPKPYLVLVTPNQEAFITEKIEQKCGLHLDWMRGSSQLISYNGGYITIIHHVTSGKGDNGNMLRKYLHRFLMFDSDFQLTHISHAFVLCNSLIQYVPGLCLDHSKNYFILSLSVHDRTIQMRKIACEDIDQMLVSVDEYILPHHNEIV